MTVLGLNWTVPPLRPTATTATGRQLTALAAGVPLPQKCRCSPWAASRHHLALPTHMHWPLACMLLVPHT